MMVLFGRERALCGGLDDEQHFFAALVLAIED